MINIRKMKKKTLFTILPLILILGSCEYNPDYVRNLRGRWKFAIGDNKEWANPTFNDKLWESIYVPSSWEEHGYKDYNGYAWYRRHIRIPKKTVKENLFLYLGRIDDVDEVYFNGRLIGSTGDFPPDFKGAYETQRRYFIPHDLIDFAGYNTIAVRVYDSHGPGGIRSGKIGIYTNDMIPVDLDLTGKWKFNLRDSLIWKNEDFDDSEWKSIHVPAYWEDQGYKDYNGYAWYRKKFDMPTELLNEKLVILAGKIDDIDQVYINGKLIGSSGKFDTDSSKIETTGYWNQFRGYYLPENITLKAKDNIIAIRIYDIKGPGGIYEGPVGIVSQENYTKYWQGKRKRQK